MSQGNILVIDDTPANLQLLMGLLSEHDYQVRPMPSGKLALEGIHLNYPELILLDIKMPDMNGYQVCQALKADPKTADIPVIFISSMDEIIDKVKAFAVGGVDYVTKPFQAQEVLMRIQTHLTLYRLQKQLQEQTDCQAQQLTIQNVQLQELNRSLETAHQQQVNLNQELQWRLQQLEKAQLQLVQSEKMAMLGQLVAGVAHEINNPVGFIVSNLSHTSAYIQDLIHHLQLYREQFPQPGEEIEIDGEDIDVEFMLQDLPKMLDSMKLGTQRIRNISKSLRTFSRADSKSKVEADLHEGIDSTLLILKHRLKSNDSRPTIKIVKKYDELPQIECYPGQLNQVFMNILANAIDAFDDLSEKCSLTKLPKNPPQITICTSILSANRVSISIEDNAQGMPEEVKQRVFEHLFTTKPVGKGTGLGLSISRQIIEEKHGGNLTCLSCLGQGTKFMIEIPV